MFAKSLFNRHLFNEMRSSRVFVDDEQGVADVYTCCSLGGRTEGNVASQTFVIAVKAGTYQFSFGIEHGTAGIASRNVRNPLPDTAVSVWRGLQTPNCRDLPSP